MHRTAFDQGAAQPIGTYGNGTWESGSVRAGQFSQRSLDPARAAIQETRGLADDQAVSAKITLDAYGTPARPQSWYGLTVRNNGYGYYALAILPNNQLQLRRALRSGANLQVNIRRGTGHRDGFQWPGTNSGWKPLATGCGVTWMETRCAKCRRASSRAEASAWPRLRRRPVSMTSRLHQP